MWYFAYGSNLNARAVADWCRLHGHRAPNIKAGIAAVLDNYRLSFPIFSEYFGGGTADITYDPGKHVAGVLFDLTADDLGILDMKVDRRLDASGTEIGTYRQIEVTVAPLGRHPPRQAITYQGTRPDRMHVPPSEHYMDLLIQGAFTHGLSMMWVAYLKSFETHQGRLPRANKPK